MKVTTRKLVAGFIAVQIAVPTLALGVRWVLEGSHPVREYPLSWQMYSSASVGHFTGKTGSGDVVRLSTEALPPIARGAGYGDSVQLMLCDANPDLVSVSRVTSNASLESLEVTC